MAKSKITISITDKGRVDLGVGRDFGPFHHDPFESMEAEVAVSDGRNFEETFARVPLPGGRRHVWVSCSSHAYSSIFGTGAPVKSIQSLLNAAWKDGEAELEGNFPFHENEWWERPKDGVAPGPYTLYPVACRMEGGSPVRHVVVVKNSATPGTPWVEGLTLRGGVWKADSHGGGHILPARPAIKGVDDFARLIPQDVFRTLSNAYCGDPGEPDGRSVAFTAGTVKLALPG